MLLLCKKYAPHLPSLIPLSSLFKVSTQQSSLSCATFLVNLLSEPFIRLNFGRYVSSDLPFWTLLSKLELSSKTCSLLFFCYLLHCYITFGVISLMLWELVLTVLAINQMSFIFINKCTYLSGICDLKSGFLSLIPFVL